MRLDRDAWLEVGGRLEAGAAAAGPLYLGGAGHRKGHEKGEPLAGRRVEAAKAAAAEGDDDEAGEAANAANVAVSTVTAVAAVTTVTAVNAAAPMELSWLAPLLLPSPISLLGAPPTEWPAPPQPPRHMPQPPPQPPPRLEAWPCPPAAPQPLLQPLLLPASASATWPPCVVPPSPSLAPPSPSLAAACWTRVEVAAALDQAAGLLHGAATAPAAQAASAEGGAGLTSAFGQALVMANRSLVPDEAAREVEAAAGEAALECTAELIQAAAAAAAAAVDWAAWAEEEVAKDQAAQVIQKAV